MSSTFGTRRGASGVSPYALRPAREGGRPTPNGPPGRSNAPRAAFAGGAAAGAADDGAKRRGLREQRAGEKSVLESARHWFWSELPSMAIVLAAAAGLALLAAAWVFWGSGEQIGAGDKLLSAAPHGGKTERLAQKAGLSLGPITLGRPGEALALGVSAPEARGGLVVISGLAPGARLSAGSPAGEDSWWLSLPDLDALTLQPPQNFVGDMDLSIELRAPDTSVVDRKTLRLSWEGEAPQIAHPSDVSETASVAPKEPVATRSQQDLAAARAMLFGAATELRGGALIETGQSAPEPGASTGSAMASAAREAMAEPKATDSALSPCFVKIEGKVVAKSRCHITREPEKRISFEIDGKELTLTYDHGRIWQMKWDNRDFGRIFKRGSCWGSERAYLCDRAM